MLGKVFFFTARALDRLPFLRGVALNDNQANRLGEAWGVFIDAQPSARAKFIRDAIKKAFPPLYALGVTGIVLAEKAAERDGQQIYQAPPFSAPSGPQTAVVHAQAMPPAAPPPEPAPIEAQRGSGASATRDLAEMSGIA